MSQVNFHDEKTHLPRLIEQMEREEGLIIARAGKPSVRLIRIKSVVRGRRFGSVKGRARVDERI